MSFSAEGDYLAIASKFNDLVFIYRHNDTTKTFDSFQNLTFSGQVKKIDMTPDNQFLVISVTDNNTHIYQMMGNSFVESEKINVGPFAWDVEITDDHHHLVFKTYY